MTSLTEIIKCSRSSSGEARGSPTVPVVDDQEANDHNESHADEDGAVVDVLADPEVAEELVDAAARRQLRHDRPRDEAAASAAEAVDLTVETSVAVEAVFCNRLERLVICIID